MSKRHRNRQAVAFRAPDNAKPAVQTAPIGMQIATAANDITIPGYSTILRPTDETLISKGGGKGIQLYREVLRDGRAYTVLSKRKRALVARNWDVVPASDALIDQKAAEVVKRQLARLAFDRLTLNLLDATLMGFSAAEVIWEREGSEIVAKRIHKIDQRRIAFTANHEPRLLTYENMLDGIAFPARKLIVHRFEEDPSDPFGIGLGRILFWHVLFKREGVAFWLKALERFASPVPIAKSPLTNMPGEQQKLLDVLAGAVVQGAIVVPTGTDIEWAKSQISGSLTHDAWCEYWDDQTSETVLGENLTTNIGNVGSKAASQTHMQVKDELVDGDADLLTATLDDTLVKWITEFNVPGAVPPSVIRTRSQNIQAEETALNARATRRGLDLNNLFRLRAAGYGPENMEETISSIFGGQRIIAVTPVADPATAAPDAPKPVPPVDPVAFAGHHASDHVDDVTGDLLDATADVRAEWIDRIRTEMQDVFASGGDMNDLIKRIDALDLPVDDISGLIDDALTKVEAKGKADIKALTGVKR